MLRTKLVLFVICLVGWSSVLVAQIPLLGPGTLGNFGASLLYSPDPSLLSATGVPAGAYVDWVVSDSPAYQLGLRQGDVVAQVDSARIASGRDVDHLFQTGALKPGQTVKVAYYRAGVLRAGTVVVSDPGSVFPDMRVPFIAKEIEDRDWSKNGLTGHSREEAMIYRDSSGRTAIEDFTGEAGKSPRKRVQILDLVAGVNIFVYDMDKDAVVIQSRLPEGFQFPNKPHKLHWVEEPSVYLGSRTIEGLVCDGYRTKRILENPGAIGVVSSTPLTFSSEQWFSELTVCPILEIKNDPLKGRSIYRLVDIRQGVEPDAKIFQVPAGYKIESRTLADDLNSR